MKLLLVGTDPRMSDMFVLAFGLRWPDTKAIVVNDALRDMSVLVEEQPDVVIVNPSFDDVSLATIVQRIRQASDVPLLVIAREGDELEAVRALELGADDYVRAPNNSVELVARVVALMRRISNVDTNAQTPITAGSLVVKPSTYEVYLDGQRLALTSLSSGSYIYW